jgi:rRNA maturation RNase YbeY
MIKLKNTQRKIKIDKVWVKKYLEEVLKILKYPDFDLGVWFTTDKTIRTYNRDYRHKDKPTDVLSFPYHTELKAGQKIKVKFEEDKNIGDIIISPEYLLKDAQKFGVSFEDRLRLILVHGVCHCLGYDHIEDADFKQMRAKESYILRNIKI